MSEDKRRSNKIWDYIIDRVFASRLSKETIDSESRSSRFEFEDLTNTIKSQEQQTSLKRLT